MEFHTRKTWADGAVTLDENIAADLMEAKTTVLEHDGICQVFSVEFDVETGELETSREVTLSVVNMLKADFEQHWFDYPNITVHPMIDRWASEFWQDAVAEEAA